jgi:flavin reductase (DIM6/NTAB) family NADH-FMN oxidoreductase RutF
VFAHQFSYFVFSEAVLTENSFKRNGVTSGHEDDLFYIDRGKGFHEFYCIDIYITYNRVHMRKIWNRPADAVWSLSTQSVAGKGNMNICTYVTAVSMEPKQMLAAVYRGTQTLKNTKVGGTVLLQLLTEDLAPVVRICGQQSGAIIDKIALLKKRYPLSAHKGLNYFNEAAGFMELRVEHLFETEGDHLLMIGRVLKGKNLVDAPILTTTFLKAHNYIR